MCPRGGDCSWTLGAALQRRRPQAAQVLVLQLWWARTFQGVPGRHCGLGLSHPPHQGDDVTVALPRVLMQVQLPQR